jgi:tetratricopeptide (TPR) repeat protein
MRIGLDFAGSGRLGLGGRAPARWWRRALLFCGAALAALGLAYLVFLRATRIDPPPLADAARAQAELPVEVRGQRVYLGPSWMSRERGLWELHLEGEPYALGFQQGRLGAPLVLEQEDFMFGEMARFVPSRIARFLLRAGVRLRYRHLADRLPLERQEEIAGLARGIVDVHGDFLPAYHRLVFYHALHDITQTLERSPLLGCSAFAAAGPATTTGHLIIGRNFDFEGPEIFDRDKAVVFYRPKGKIPFASVAWAGMSGVVTGLNAQGIYVSINAARTDDKGQDGVPVELLVRQVMEEAHTLDEALRILKRTPVLVPDFYLLGDGKTGESAVLERSPRRFEVRRAAPGSGEVTVLTNHALTPAFAGDAENDRLRRYLTSGARFARLKELTQKWRGSIDARRAVEILRDKKGVGGEPLGLGNRNALDALIATHSVVVDAAALTLWVSTGPHLLGRYVGYDLKHELLGEERAPPPDLPPDPMADSDEHRAYLLAHASLKAAARLAAIDPDRALEELRKAAALEEKLPEPHRLLGDAYRARARVEEARREYQRFLELSPPYLKDVEEVRGLLGTL